MKDKLKKYLLPNLPYLFFVYLFDKLCQAVRLAPGLDVSEKLLHNTARALNPALPAGVRRRILRPT